MASAQAPTATDTDTTAAETKTQTELTESFQDEPASALPEAITEAPAAAEPTEAGAPTVDEKDKELQAKWPGWPGCIVFRIVVPVLKVGGIIGRKGDLIKKLVEETRARVRILDGPVSSPDRIVLISGKEEPEALLPPAIDAAIRIFKSLHGLPDGEVPDAAGAAFCLIRLIVASAQATSLIGKQGSVIKLIQESSGASVRVLSNDELPIYASSEERIVELHGEALKVLKGLEAVLGHLRKFLVDHSVLPLFEKNYNAPVTQEQQVDAWSDKTLHSSTSQTAIDADYPHLVKRDSLFVDRDSLMESHINPSRLSLYGPESGLDVRTSAMGRAGRPVVTQVAQTMQIPLAYAEDIIGVGGANIAYIRRTSGAILTVQESRGLPEEITVEIKGTSSQVLAAQQLIQEFTNSHKESLPSSYGQLDSTSRPSYAQLGSNSYSSSMYDRQPYGDYGSSGIGGYNGYRL
ncbi:RNA-binding KH domain-containing protein PEPPER-like [Olea europaea var. sylvestris]|uniref:RNA-binding KH domain-containing protein PEPPER-like n=1 Tax=Olea europaea var. sylvestris TaxID=158386 RepID=UPI000C1D88BD|nr:RNA-binding KH domain-containing protein PEPPER-like [Olea europaea var. sylvestris]